MGVGAGAGAGAGVVVAAEALLTASAIDWRFASLIAVNMLMPPKFAAIAALILASVAGVAIVLEVIAPWHVAQFEAYKAAPADN